MTTNHNFNGIDDQLDQALARLAFGVPVETILAEAGDDAAQLRSLLEIAGQVASLKSAIPIPPPDASLQKLLAHGQKLATPAAPPSPGRWASLFNIFNGGLRLAAGMATALLLFLVLSGTAFVVAQRSLPGDALYGLKQAGEQVQLDLAGSSLRREQLTQQFNQRRRAEIEALLKQGRSDPVTFEGQVQALNPGSVVLDGLTVQLGPETNIVGQLSVGARVRADVRTLPPTGVVALTITVIEPGPLPTPSPTASPTPTFTAQPTPTLAKVQATDTLPPTATPPKAQATDSITMPPSPTPLPTAKPTETPPVVEDSPEDNSDTTLNDDSNQNGEDNFDDNADENSDFNNDNFNDNSDEFDDGDRNNNSTDNSGQDNRNADDHSGSSGSSDDSADDGDHGNDDSSDTHDSSNDDNNDGDSHDNDNS